MDNNIEKLQEKAVTLETVCKTTQFLMILLPFALAVVLIYCSLYDIALNSYIRISFGVAFLVLFLLFLVCDVKKDKCTWQKTPDSLTQDKVMRKN